MTTRWRIIVCCFCPWRRIWTTRGWGIIVEGVMNANVIDACYSRRVLRVIVCVKNA